MIAFIIPAHNMDRFIRTTVGLRPHRDSGFLLHAEQLDGKTVIHHFGHGGAGMALSWGAAGAGTGERPPGPGVSRHVRGGDRSTVFQARAQGTAGSGVVQAVTRDGPPRGAPRRPGARTALQSSVHTSSIALHVTVVTGTE